MKTKRVYKAEIMANGLESTARQVRLVRAETQAKAFAFIVKEHVTIELCSPDDAVKFGSGGGEIEDAE